MITTYEVYDLGIKEVALVVGVGEFSSADSFAQLNNFGMGSGRDRSERGSRKRHWK
jgi:hypothetical protein